MADKNSQKKSRREKRRDAGAVILRPHITEKGAVLAERNVYVFTIASSANKRDVSRAMEELFKVRPLSVRIVRTQGKRRFTRGTNRWGRTAGVKKAYVFLKQGEAIDIS